MNTVIDFFRSERNRAYIYRVLIAIGGLLAVYGVFTDEQLAQVVGLVTVVLNVLPTANTSTQ